RPGRREDDADGVAVEDGEAAEAAMAPERLRIDGQALHRRAAEDPLRDRDRQGVGPVHRPLDRRGPRGLDRAQLDGGRGHHLPRPSAAERRTCCVTADGGRAESRLMSTRFCYFGVPAATSLEAVRSAAAGIWDVLESPPADIYLLTQPPERVGAVRWFGL